MTGPRTKTNSFKTKTIDGKYLNVVPTTHTKRAVNAMVAKARRDSGPDAAAELLHHIPEDQWPAAVGLLLGAVKMRALPGRPRQPLRFSEEERLEGNRRYRAGHRDEWTVLRWREYQRVAQQRRTERIGRQGRS